MNPVDRWQREFARCFHLALALAMLGWAAPSFAKSIEDGSPGVQSASGEASRTSGVDRDRRRRRSHSCAQRIRQLVHFDDRVTRAKAQGNQAWAASTQAHIGYLEAGLARRCPGYYAERARQKKLVYMWRKTKQVADAMVDLGKKVGMAMATGGANAWKSVLFRGG